MGPAMGRGTQRLGRSAVCHFSRMLKLTCAVIRNPIRSSMIHERIARGLVPTVHLGGVVLVCSELEMVVSCREASAANREDQMN